MSLALSAMQQWLPRLWRPVLLLAVACPVLEAAVARQRFASVDRFAEEQLGVCRNTVDGFNAKLLQCEIMLQKVEATCPGCTKGPVCNCHCPTCVPKVWEEFDMDKLPPCTTMAPEEDAKALYLAANGAFQYPVPVGQVYVDTILTPPTEPPTVPMDLIPEVPKLTKDRMAELGARPMMALVDAMDARGSKQVSRREQVQAEMRQCQESAVEVEGKLRSCDEERKHYEGRLRFLRKGGDPHQCICKCPPCDASFAAPPTCNPDPNADAPEE